MIKFLFAKEKTQVSLPLSARRGFRIHSLPNTATTSRGSLFSSPGMETLPWSPLSGPPRDELISSSVGLNLWKITTSNMALAWFSSSPVIWMLMSLSTTRPVEKCAASIHHPTAVSVWWTHRLTAVASSVRWTHRPAAVASIVRWTHRPEVAACLGILA